MSHWRPSSKMAGSDRFPTLSRSLCQTSVRTLFSPPSRPSTATGSSGPPPPGHLAADLATLDDADGETALLV
jgi:hypothetical protein